MSEKRVSTVPSGALVHPTLMVTVQSASAVYAHPAGEVKRLEATGALLKVARGYYIAVPIHKRNGHWLPSMEAIAAGMSVSIYGPDDGAIWGLSAARIHGCLPRAISTGYACGPRQHRKIDLVARDGDVQFMKRDTERLDLELFNSEIGPALVTSVAQTILDLGRREFNAESSTRTEVVRNLMSQVDTSELINLAARSRGQTALKRALRLVNLAE